MDEELREEFGNIRKKLDQLADLPTQVALLVRALDTHIRDDRILFFGENETPGLILKVDRLEQSRASQQKLMWGLLTAFAGVVAAAGWEVLKEHLK